MNTYRIPEENIEKLNKLAKRIQNKCAKYGCDFHYAEIGEEFETFTDKGTEYVERFVIIECEGITQVNDWEFIGAVDFTENGNIIRTVVDVEVPDRYRNIAPICEHCNINRPRKYGYIIRNTKTGEFKQVGKACLKDFTGGLSIEMAAMFMSFISEVEDSMEFDPFEFGTFTYGKYYDTDEILAHAYNLVKDLGYFSVSNCESYMDSTKAKVINSVDYNHGKLNSKAAEYVEDYRMRFNPDFESEKTVAAVKAIKEYVLSLEANSDYIKNLQIIAKNEYVANEHIGYCVSMVPYYNHYLEKLERDARIAAEKRADSISEFQGNVGDKITINNPKMSVITSWENQFGGYVVRFKITDENNNVYMWDCSTFVDEIDSVISIKGTIKKHDTYNGVNQTWLTRCKVKHAKKEEAPHAEWNSENYDTIMAFC